MSTENNIPILYAIVAHTNDYSRLEYVGHRVAISEEAAIAEFADKDRLTVFPLVEVAGYTITVSSTAPKIDPNTITEKRDESA